MKCQHDWVETVIKRIKCRACRKCRQLQIKTKPWPDGKRWTWHDYPMKYKGMRKWASEILSPTPEGPDGAVPDNPLSLPAQRGLLDTHK